MDSGARLAATPDEATSLGPRPSAIARPTAGLRCRLIAEADLDAVVRVLREGFADRSESYWRQGLARHAARALPGGVPRYGYVLDFEGEVVGVLLTLYTIVEQNGATHRRCNLSSWYVVPRFRAQAVLLDGLAMRDKSVTYCNVSPAPQTWAIQEARGFVRYCRGQMLILPALSRPAPGQRVQMVSTEAQAAGLPPRERALLVDHARYGCLCLLGSDGRETRLFVLQARRLKLFPRRAGLPGLPCFQVIYAPAQPDLVRWLGAIGRFLLRRHAMPWIVLDADGPVSGAVGRYFDGRAPKYTRGPHPVPLGDLTYTELVLFGP